MNWTNTGFIFYVLKYHECVKFYRDVLKLDIMFDTPELTCFKFGDSYLMIEFDDRPRSPNQTAGNNSCCLRINVPNVQAVSDELVNLGIEVDYREHHWGTVAKFFDPEGNLCAFKDDQTFEQQINEYC